MSEVEIGSLVYPNYPIGVGGSSEVCRVVDMDACHWYIVPIHTPSEPIRVPLSCVRSIYP